MMGNTPLFSVHRNRFPGHVEVPKLLQYRNAKYLEIPAAYSGFVLPIKSSQIQHARQKNNENITLLHHVTSNYKLPKTKLNDELQKSTASLNHPFSKMLHPGSVRNVTKNRTMRWCRWSCLDRVVALGLSQIHFLPKIEPMMKSRCVWMLKFDKKSADFAGGLGLPRSCWSLWSCWVSSPLASQFVAAWRILEVCDDCCCFNCLKLGFKKSLPSRNRTWILKITRF